MEGAKERLMQFINSIDGLTPKAFEIKCKLGNGYVAKPGVTIREPKLELISNAFPNLNIDWLRTGYGSMLNGAELQGDEPRISHT
ncbi:MAG: hypothetical protein ACRCZZ_04820, partial [Phocaeicola sp.]